MEELEAWGSEPAQRITPGPEAGELEMDVARVITVSYTSGTTGETQPRLSSMTLTTSREPQGRRLDKLQHDDCRHLKLSRIDQGPRRAWVQVHQLLASLAHVCSMHFQSNVLTLTAMSASSSCWSSTWTVSSA